MGSRALHPPMPLFRFHVKNDIDVPDEEGQQFANLALAHLAAIDAVRDIAAATVRLGRLNMNHRIEIEDERGNVLLAVTFAEAIDISK